MMADRGFDADDLLPEGLQCNVPPFLGNRDQLEPAEVEHSQDSYTKDTCRKSDRKNKELSHYFYDPGEHMPTWS